MGATGGAHFTFSGTGSLIYVSGLVSSTPTAAQSIAVADRKGE
jgi:hypothetical protein